MLAEETDLDAEGKTSSHFELYVDAMVQAGASIDQLGCFMDSLNENQCLLKAVERAQLPVAICEFISFSWNIAKNGSLEEKAAVFAFSREILIPDMFYRIVGELNQMGGNHLQAFIYYLERHIHLDGEQHGPLSEVLVLETCGQDDGKWNRAMVAAKEGLRLRARLWDEILLEMQS